jgi:hypothetical protein
MKKLIPLLFILLSTFTSYSQFNATIDDNGKKVVLNSDGTWDYKNLEKTDSQGTGIWKINYFYDEFGDKTNNGFITTNNPIRGVFSNSATTNSALDVAFVISAQNRLAVVLDEYASNNILKAFSTTNYSVNIKDSDGVIHSLRGIMYDKGDRIFIDTNTRKKHINKLHQILMEGGDISMSIKENSQYGGVSIYSFKFNANGYKNIFNNFVKN